MKSYQSFSNDSFDEEEDAPLVSPWSLSSKGLNKRTAGRGAHQEHIDHGLQDDEEALP